MSIKIFLFFVFSLIQSIWGQDIETWSFSHQMDNSGNYNLTTTVHLNAKIIEFETRVRIATSGWIGLGLSPNPNMRGSDIFIGTVIDGTPAPRFDDDDYYATENGLPMKDNQPAKDWIVTDSSRTNGVVTMKFRRPFAVTNTTYDREIKNENVYLIWAYGTMNVTAGTPNYHGNTTRGSKQINLLRKPSFSSSVPTNFISTFLLAACWIMISAA